MPVVAKTSATTILLWAGSYPAQFLFYKAWEKMTAQNPPETGIIIGIVGVFTVAAGGLLGCKVKFVFEATGVH